MLTKKNAAPKNYTPSPNCTPTRANLGVMAKNNQVRELGNKPTLSYLATLYHP